MPGSSNPDFQAGIGGLRTGMVHSVLTGNAPTPLLFGAPCYVQSAESFAEWFGAAAQSKQLSTHAMMALGLAGLGFVTRRRRERV